MRKPLLLVFTLVALATAGISPAVAQEAGTEQEKPKEITLPADPITGTWDGSIVMPDGSMPFFMTLKLEKDQVIGEIGNAEGSTPLTGTWAEGKLAISFTYVNGEAITMTGAFKDDQLSGELNVNAGQAVMAFVAKKKEKA